MHVWTASSPPDALDPASGTETAQRIVVVRRHRVTLGEVITVELAGQELLTLVLVQLQIAAARRLDVQTCEDGISRGVESIGMIANVERREMESECPGPINQWLHDGLSPGIGAVQPETLGDRFEVVDEILRGVVGHAVGLGR